MRKCRAAWAARPRSCMEWYEFTRDDIVFQPRFQWVWWWTGCCVVSCEYAVPTTAEFCLMIIMCYVLFTLPCLRFCTVWTKLYQERRNAKPPEEEPPPEKEPNQKKKKAMTEEEMLEATRKRQKNRTEGMQCACFCLLRGFSLFTPCCILIFQMERVSRQKRKKSVVPKEWVTKPKKTTLGVSYPS